MSKSKVLDEEVPLWKIQMGKNFLRRSIFREGYKELLGDEGDKALTQTETNRQADSSLKVGCFSPTNKITFATLLNYVSWLGDQYPARVEED